MDHGSEVPAERGSIRVAIDDGFADFYERQINDIKRGIDQVTAVSLLTELGDLRRFPNADKFIAYLGLMPSEYTSFGRRRTGNISNFR